MNRGNYSGYIIVRGWELLKFTGFFYFTSKLPAYALSVDWKFFKLLVTYKILNLDLDIIIIIIKNNKILFIYIII